MGPALLNVTLDMNCIIDLEQGNSNSVFIKRLIQLNKDRKISLRVVAIGASERMPSGMYAENFAEFQQKIAAVGLGDAEILKPVSYLGMSFLDYCVFAGEETEKLERRIHEALFPCIDFEYREFCKRHNLNLDDEIDHRWRNPKCDTLALWSHIWNHGDVFVTSDNDFHKESVKPRLIAIGAGRILKPEETVDII